MYVALPFPQAFYFPFPRGFVSAAAGARHACLGKAFSVSLCLLYLETQDKLMGALTEEQQKGCVGKAQWEKTLGVPRGYLLQAGLAR